MIKFERYGIEYDVDNVVFNSNDCARVIIDGNTVLAQTSTMQSKMADAAYFKSGDSAASYGTAYLMSVNRVSSSIGDVTGEILSGYVAQATLTNVTTSSPIRVGDILDLTFRPRQKDEKGFIVSSITYSEGISVISQTGDNYDYTIRVQVLDTSFTAYPVTTIAWNVWSASKSQNPSSSSFASNWSEQIPGYVDLTYKADLTAQLDPYTAQLKGGSSTIIKNNDISPVIPLDDYYKVPYTTYGLDGCTFRFSSVTGYNNRIYFQFETSTAGSITCGFTKNTCKYGLTKILNQTAYDEYLARS